MSRGLVSARPFAHKKKKHSFKRMLNKTGIPLPTISLTISQRAKEILSRTVISVILLTFCSIFLIKGVFFKSEFKMEKVKWSQHTIETYEDIELFNSIVTAIKGKNYYVLNTFQKKNILSSIKKTFPFVQEIHFQLETGNTLGIDLAFIQPLFKVKLGEKEFWIWSEEFFIEIQSGVALGANSFVIDTPRYLTGTTSLSGFFFEISLNDFQHIIPLMQEHIPNMVRFVYLVGSTRLAIFTDDEQVIYFNFRTPENLQEQFKKYHTLQQYYQNFSSIASIDLGSLDATKVIVKKK